jgi:short-subunit dehydrogenase
VFGAMEVTKAMLPLLRQYGVGSRVVFVSSIAGLVTVDLTGVYAASKYALEAVGDAFRSELSHWGIHVSIIEPGGIAVGSIGEATPSSGVLVVL